MTLQFLNHKPTKLFLVITAFFVANALIAECIGGKIFSLEKLLGLQPFNFSFFGEQNLSLNLTAGVILWPLEFVVTDIVNEFYGAKAVKRISYIAVGLISYAFLMFYMAMGLPPADFWPGTGRLFGVPDANAAFNFVFGQGMWIIIGSLTAFLVSQLVDVTIFHKIKTLTGEKMIWMRATGSTLISQLVDSFIVLFIAFYIGRGWNIQTVLAICVVNYIYKFTIAILLTPLIYLLHTLIRNYVGTEEAKRMEAEAMNRHV